MNYLKYILTTLQNGTITLPEEVGSKLETITIPTFVDFGPLIGSSSTIFSFLAFIGSLATVGIAIFWVYKIVRLGIDGIQSEGKQEKLQELTKRLQNIFVGVFMSFLFPVILSIVGIFAGIGTVFEWPRMFRSCNSPSYEYYFQAYLAKEGQTATQQADAECGFVNAGVTNTIEQN